MNGRRDFADYPRDMVGYGAHPPDPRWRAGRAWPSSS